MKDEEILEFYENLIKEKYRSITLVKMYFPKFYDAIISKYADTLPDDSLRCIIYRIQNKIDIRPVCIVCGKPVKFRAGRNRFNITCSKKCSNSGNILVKKLKEQRQLDGMINSLGENYQEIINNRRSLAMKTKYGVTCAFDINRKENIEKAKRTWNDKYGVDNPWKSESIRELIKQTWNDKYGVDNPWKSKEILEKRKQTWLEKYQVDNPMKSKEIQEKGAYSCLKKYQVDNPWKSKEILEKRKQTWLEKYQVDNPMKVVDITNKSFSSRDTSGVSKIEKLFYGYLSENGYDFIYQYNSDKYPYNCDFYIKSLDLYIEIQGFWTHGLHPFNETDINDIHIIERWKTKNSMYMTKPFIIGQ